MSPAPFALSVPLALVLLLIAAPAVVAARGGWAGTLRRDGRLGVHARAATTSDDAFRVANRVAAPVVAGAAAVAVLAAVLVLALRLPTAATMVVAAIGLVGAVALLLVAGSLGERAAQTVPVPARRPGSDGPGCGSCACGSGGCAGLTRDRVAEIT